MRLLIAVLLSLHATNAAPARPGHNGKIVMYGNLHAHSNLSRDADKGANMTPLAAFRSANASGLDFLAISDHHKAVDAPKPPFRIAPTNFEDQLYRVALRYSETNANKFVAIPGIEWGNDTTGNHLNLVGLRQLPSDDIKNRDYDKIFDWARQHAEFVVFNHPYSWVKDSKRDKTVGNFGEALHASQSAFVQHTAPIARGISMITSIEGGHISGKHRDSTAKTHREGRWEDYYKKYLNMGFRIGPTACQDTHGPNFGTVNAARTAVWCDRPSYADLMAGFKAGRIYATEDDEMVVAFEVRYRNAVYWMGDRVPLAEEAADVELLVKVWQADGVDGDATDEGPYTIQVVSDQDGAGGSEASIEFVSKNVPSAKEVAIPFSAKPGAYVYIVVVEEGGKDNAVGEGEDELNNETRAHGRDGKRDDLNDTAWTSPIWFGRQQGGAAPVVAPGGYVWSVASADKKYHDANCWLVARIGAANRRAGATPPAGWQKHGCRAGQ